MKRPALAKGSPKTPLKKGIIKRHNLKKLGEMNLKEKVQKVTEEHENERDAAAELQKQLTPAEKSRAWGRHQTHLCQKGHEEEKKTFEKGNKKEKGYLTALFLMRQEAPKFCNTSESVQAESKLTYREKWMSEKEAMEKFGDDLDHHLGSGRVSWRECSRTWGVYEYLDNEDYEKTTTGKLLARKPESGLWHKSMRWQRMKASLGRTTCRRSSTLCSWSTPLGRGRGLPL